MKTTDINKIKAGAGFAWGAVMEIIDVGPYTIVSHRPWKVSGSNVLTGTADPDKNHYHGWINGKDAHQGWETLDEALAGLIAIRHDGPNCQAGEYFIRSLTNLNE